MFSQRKTEVSYGNTIPRNFDVIFGMLRKTLESMNCNAAPMWRFLCAKQLIKCSSVGGRKKKSAWTDLELVDFEKKNFKESMFKSKNRRGQV